MTRRDLMTVASLLPAWGATAQTSYQPAFLSAAEFGVLETFTEILIPSDETPGAREARVAQYIDFVLNNAGEYASEVQRDWRKALDWLMAANFGSLSAAEKLALVEQMASPKHGGFATFRLIKQMTVFAFYTSKAGLIDNLEYKGNAYLTEFPGCAHPEHRKV